MRTRVPFVGAGLMLLLAVGVFGLAADEKPKYTIKDVMEMAHKGSPPLCKKGVEEKLSKEEATKLVALYEALVANKPPKGDAGDWKKKTGALVDAAKAAEKGDKGYGALFKVAVNCAACHKLHKGK